MNESISRIRRITKEAKEIGRSSPARAIALLRTVEDQADFYPWGAYDLAKLLRRNNQLEESLRIVRRLTDVYPDNLAGWAMLLQLLGESGSAELASQAENLFAILRQRDKVKETWFRTPFIRALLDQTPSDWKEMAAKGLHSRLISLDEFELIDQILTDDESVQARVKLVLCRPRGGLNDTLSEIEKCWRYAETRGRRLLIDTTRSGLHDRFWNYFRVAQADRTVIAADVHPEILNRLDTYPTCLQGRIDSYRIAYSQAQDGIIDISSGLLLTFDHDSPYEHTLLVHDQCLSQADPMPVCCLGRLAFVPGIGQAIQAIIASNRLHDYDAIHIRHTDLKSNYVEFLDAIYPQLIDRDVLIASDSFDVIQYASKFLNRSRTVRISRFGDNRNSPLHFRVGRLPKDAQLAINMDLFADLVGLAGAKNLWYPSAVSEILEDGSLHSTSAPSGFSSLADALRQRKDILDQLIDLG